MRDEFFAMSKEGQLNEMLMSLFEFTTPGGGLEDYIFFDKKEAIEYLNDQFSFDLNDPEETDTEDIKKYQKILDSIEEMKYFIAFKSEDVEEYYVDDYSKYARELVRQIIEEVDEKAYDLDGDC